MLYFVGAFTQNYAMGNKGHLPWRHAPMRRDTERLKNLITGKTLVMGERTYHDYKNIGKTFQTTKILVLSKKVNNLPDAHIYKNIQDVVALSKSEDLWVIGGGQIFSALLPNADTMYLTRVETVLEGDVFFPKYSSDDWIISETHFPADADNPYPYTFLELHRKQVDATQSVIVST